MSYGFEERERELIERFKNDPVGYPFALTDEELDTAVRAIKRQRGDAEAQVRRIIRCWVARRFKWHFALDGGFMPDQGEPGYSEKFWPYDSYQPFSKVYQMFENMVLFVWENYHNDKSLEDVLKEVEVMLMKPDDRRRFLEKQWKERLRKLEEERDRKGR